MKTVRFNCDGKWADSVREPVFKTYDGFVREVSDRCAKSVVKSGKGKIVSDDTVESVSVEEVEKVSTERAEETVKDSNDIPAFLSKGSDSE